MKLFFHQKGYTALEPDIHKIQPTEKKVFFIDGGNALINDKGKITEQHIRTAVICFEGKKRTKIKQQEGICTTELFIEEGEERKQYYLNTLSGSWIIQHKVDAHHRKLAVADRIVPIHQLGEMMRRFAELEEAKILAEQYTGVIIVLDGTLESTHPGEEEKLQQLYEVIEQNNNMLVGFAKTNRMLAENGILFTEYLRKNLPQDSWYAYPLAETQTPLYQADMCFVKLHRKSRHVFRIDVRGDVSAVVNALATTAIDLSFPGYPYGLVMADRLARVSNEEKRMRKQRQEVMLKESDNMEMDVHDILDKFNY